MPYPFKDKKIGNEYLLDEIRTRLEKGAKKYGEKILPSHIPEEFYYSFYKRF